MTMRRRTVGLSVLLTITLGFVAVGARATPAGAPSTSTLGTATPMVRTSNDAGWVGPPFLPRIQDLQTALGMVFDDVEQTVARQKLTFRMPAVTAVQYVGVCFLNNSGNLVQNGRLTRAVGTCPAAQEFFDDAIATIPSAARPNGAIGVGAEAWFQSPPGSQRPFGLLPPVRVNSVAFGSIPVTAIVHISQPLRDGTIQPFSLRWLVTFGSVPALVVIPGYGLPPAGGRYFCGLPPIFGGPVEIRLSDVEVDGVPVPVGNDCAAAAEVNFHPRGGYTSAKNPPPQKGAPGEFAPLSDFGSFLPGTVDIEPFSNCRDGGEDLAPLLTNMISGPGNHIDMTMKAKLTEWCKVSRSRAYPYQVGNVYCDLNAAPPVGQTMTAQRAKSAASSAQSLPESFLDELPATVRKQLAGFIKLMTPPPTSTAKR